MRALKLSFMAMLSVIFSSSVLANFTVDNVYIDYAITPLEDVPGQTATNIVNVRGVFSHAVFDPDSNDLNFGSFYREQVSAGPAGYYNTMLFSTSNITNLASLTGDFESGFGMTVTNAAGEGATLGVFNSPYSGDPYFYWLDNTYLTLDGSPIVNGFHPVDLAPAGSDGFLRLSIIDDGFGFLLPSFSYDGVTYTALDEWDSTFILGGVFYGISPSGGEATAFGQTAVPVPAAAWLFASALAGLGFTRRNRK